MKKRAYKPITGEGEETNGEEKKSQVEREEHVPAT